MRNKFKVAYEIDDGYVGGSAPHYTSINESHIDDDMTDGELRELYLQTIAEDFERSIFPCGTNEQEFIEWAKDVLKARKV